MRTSSATLVLHGLNRVHSAPMFDIAIAVGLAFLSLIAIYYIQAVRYDGPPTVFPSIPFLGDAYQFLYNPTHYLDKCRARYGPIFRCLVGPQKIIVICDPVGIQGILRDKARVLSSAANYHAVGLGIADVGVDMSHYLPDRLLPLTSEIFSQAQLCHIAPALNRVLKTYVDNMETAAYNPQYIPLTQFVGESLYAAVSVSVFGKSFPVSTFPDFELVDLHFSDLLTRLPFLGRSAKLARARMVKATGEYIEAAGPSHGAGVLPEPSARLLSILCDLGLEKKDRDGMLFLFMWGLHSSQIRVAFWLFTYLLNDPPALARLRESIDNALTQNYQGDINALVDAPAGSLDAPEFALLTSAVKEAIRASFAIAPMREVCEDTVVTLSTGETFPLRKGEHVAPNISMVHNEADSFEAPGVFILERFTPEYAKEREAREGLKKGTYLPWGGGEHICKGRFIAQHAIKMFVILTLRSLDITAIDPKTHKALGAGFLPHRLTYLQKWRMTMDQPVQVCVRKRYGNGDDMGEDD